MQLNAVNSPLPLVGRQHEINTLAERIKQVTQGEGHIIGIHAEAGMGKTRLNAELINMAAQADLRIVGGTSQSYNTHLIYDIWKEAWRSLFSIAPNSAPDEQIAHLERALHSIHADLVERMPLLAPVLRMNIPENSLTDSLPFEVRVDVLHTMLLQCLRHYATQKPILIVLEDCQWADAHSINLLAHIARSISDIPVLISVLYRPLNTISTLRNLDTFTELSLARLDSDESRTLIMHKLRQRFGDDFSNPDDLINRMLNRASGNPFYIEEMMNFLHDQQLDLQDVQPSHLPASLNSLIISRINLLSDDEKHLLRVASIIGEHFDAYRLTDIQALPNSTSADSQNILDKLADADITPVDTSKPERRYRFKHAITRDAIYNSIDEPTKAVLHHAVAQHIERMHADHIADYYDLLAYHYSQSGDYPKRREYLHQAAQAAQRDFAHEAARDYLERLLPLVDDAQRGETLLRLGAIWQVTDQKPRAEAAYRDALMIASQYEDKYLRARCEQGLGELLTQSTQPADALMWLQRAQNEFVALNKVTEQIQVLRTISSIYLDQQHFDAANDTLEQQASIIQNSLDKRSLVENQRLLALVAEHQGDHAKALQYRHQTLDTAHEINDQRGIIAANQDLAHSYFSQGNYERTLTHSTAALDAAMRIGWLRAAAQVIGNAGELYQQYGMYDAALTCYTQQLDVGLALGHSVNIMHALGSAAVAEVALKNYGLAYRLITQAIVHAREQKHPSAESEFMYTQAEVEYYQSRYSDAHETIEDAIEIAHRIDSPSFRIKARILADQIDVARGLTPVSMAINGLKRMLRDDMSAAFRAAIHDAIYRFDPNLHESRTIAASIYRELYAQMPHHLYRERYEALTNEALPPAAPLPNPPAYLSTKPEDLLRLLERAETLH